MSDELGRFIACNRWSSETRDKYKRVISRFIEQVGEGGTLDAAGLSAWLDSQPWGVSMRHVGMNAVKNWLRWKYGENHPALSLKLRRAKPKPQRTLTMEKVVKLLEHFDTSKPKGRRDLAMCTLFLDTGLRVSEISRLEMRYLDLESRRLDVIVKGGEWEAAVFSPYTANYLMAWFSDRARVVLKGVGVVFIGVGGNTPGQSMTRDGIKTNVRIWGERSGIGALSPHDFRRTFATLGTKLGAPTRIIQEAGRWKSVKMVERYTQAIDASDFDPYSPVMAAMKFGDSV